MNGELPKLLSIVSEPETFDDEGEDEAETFGDLLSTCFSCLIRAFNSESSGFMSESERVTTHFYIRDLY